jgi:hypothetical protein
MADDSLPSADPAAILSAMAERDRLVAIGYPREPQDVPRLIAALRAALGEHTEAVIEDMRPPKFHYCSRCSGHPEWPCPEVQAITAALTGEGDRG